MRVGASHDWPLLLKHAAVPRVTASAKSASGRMMFADLPPSSCATRFTVSAATFATMIPALVEPVNDIIATSG